MTTATDTFEGFLRSITLLDNAPDTGIDPPVHVTSKLLLNGEQTTVPILGEGWAISVAQGEPTTVSFYVHESDCNPPIITEDGTCIDGGHIGGFHFLSPKDAEWTLRDDGYWYATVYVREVLIKGREVPA